MYKLIIEDDEGKTTPVPIIRDEITIGRKEGNTIRLTERNVSRRHARIVRQNGALYIEDLQSYNGIKVNNEKIQGKAPLGDGDVVVIGDYRLSIKQDKAEAKPPAPAMSMPGVPASSQAPTVASPALQASSLPTVQHQAMTAPMGATSKGPDKPGRLIVISSNFARQEFPLEKAAMVIGRTDDNDIVLNHRSISRHHAKIVREGDHFHVVDLQSANGVRVNGEEYGKVELRKGDQIDLGHVRLIFVPPGQEIDVSNKIVDLDSGRSPVAAIVIGVLVLAIVGGGAFWWFNRPPSVDPETEAAKTLVDVESDLQAKRWRDVIDKTSRILSSTGISSKVKDAAQSKKSRAEQETKAKQIYEKFSTGAGSGNYDQALAAYREIPEDSVYRQIAREQYDQIFPLYVENHLKAAEEARGQGKCSEFQSQLQAILSVDPKQSKALAAKERPCGEKGERTVADNTSDTPSKPERVREPRSPRKPKDDGGGATEKEKPAPAEKPAPVESGADVDTRLSEAQTEYVNGNYSKAIEMAKSVQKGSPVRAWRIIGSAACNIKDLKLVNDAYRRLDASGRQYLVYVCQRNGIQNTGNQFKLSE
jgi:pSer/pThr/pTyr-binding forkhead associated (FHA) protein